MDDLVSIIVTSYNHAEYLDQRMESLLNQTYARIEIIVIDDCSTDGSLKVLEKYKKYTNIKVIAKEKNSGYADTGNMGVRLSNGEYIMFAECDDFSEPTHVEVLMERMLLNRSAGVCYCRSNMVDANGATYGSDFEIREKSFQKFCYKDVLIPQTMMQSFLLIACVVPNMSAAIIKNKYFYLVGGFDPKFKACADWDFWCRISRYCDFFYVSVALNNFRNHPTTVRNNAGIERQVLETYDILYKTYSELDITMKESLRFRCTIGMVWAAHVFPCPMNWAKSFFNVWRKSMRYDRFICFYLLVALPKMAYPFLSKIDFQKLLFWRTTCG